MEVKLTDFKFQSDSINTKAKHLLTGLLYCFKFQSDSINTVDENGFNHVDAPLNSNLILLIHLSMQAFYNEPIN